MVSIAPIICRLRRIGGKIRRSIAVGTNASGIYPGVPAELAIGGLG